MRIWIIFILVLDNYVSSLSTHSYTRIPTELMTLEADVDSTSAWSMKSLYGTLISSKIISYQIDGESPCAVQNPYLMLKNLHTYGETNEILDFAIIDFDLYYITSEALYSINIVSFSENNNLKATKIKDISGSSYEYVNAFKFSNSDRLIFLKENSNAFAYIVISSSGTVSEIMNTESNFDEFTSEMRMIIYNDIVYIPAGTKGIIQYNYKQDDKVLKFERDFTNIKDARDIAIKYSEKHKGLIMLVADYRQGLVKFILNPDDGTRTSEEVMKEFIKAKSVTMATTEERDTVILIIDALGGSSKYVALNLTIGDTINLNYDQIRLIDGVANYGDSNEDYASIIMYNSVMIIKITQEGESMIGYVNSQDVNNAKLLKLQDGFTTWLVHSRGKEIIITDLLGSSGFLFCQSNEEVQSYNFFVLGQAKNCKNPSDGQTLSNCYYEMEIELHVVDKESLDDLKFLAIIVGIVVGVLVVIIGIIIAFICRKYSITKTELAKYEKLNARQSTEEKKN